MSALKPLICLVAVLGLIWFGAGALVDLFWCAGCSRSVTASQALIALTFFAGLAAGLLAAAWAQVSIEENQRREDALRRAQGHRPTVN